MINGGSKTNEIIENTFDNSGQKSILGSSISTYAPSLSNYMRTGYFNSESAPMIHLYVPKFYDYLSPNISIRNPEFESITTLKNNTFSDISLSQAAVKT